MQMPTRINFQLPFFLLYFDGIMSIRLTSAQKGILCIICSAFFFTVMNLCAKLSGDLPSIQKAFFRNSIACCASLFFLIKTRQFALPQKKEYSLLYITGSTGHCRIGFQFLCGQSLSACRRFYFGKARTVFYHFLLISVFKGANPFYPNSCSRLCICRKPFNYQTGFCRIRSYLCSFYCLLRRSLCRRRVHLHTLSVNT